MKLSIRNIISGLFCCILAASCAEDNEKYEAGAPVSADCVRAYFPSSNKGEIIKSDQDEQVITVKVSRENTNGSVTIPLIVKSKTENVTIPADVTFADGEEETTFDIQYAGLDITPKFDIALPEEYTDPYKIKNGSIEYAASVFRLTLLATMKYGAYDTSDVMWSEVTTSCIYQMGKENLFVWSNFYGSGKNLKFKVSGTFDADNVYKTKGDIIPLDHCNSDGGYGWYFMGDEEGTEWYSWTLPESGEQIDWLYFFDEYEGDSYFYIEFAPIITKTKAYGWGFAYAAVVNTSGNYVSNYFYMYYDRTQFDDSGNYIGQ